MTLSDHNPLIAIVDDDESVRLALVGLIRSLGHRAQAYETAEAFLAAPGADRFACIVTDLQLPGISGVDLKRRLDAQGSRIPVIMITARTEAGLLQRARDSRPLCLLSKPFDAAALIDCLDRALNEPAP